MSTGMLLPGGRRRSVSDGRTRAEAQPASHSGIDESVRALLAVRDPVGIEMAYDSWGCEAFAIARRLLHQQAAEDAVVAGFLQVWRQSDSELARHGTLRTYLCRWVADEAARRTAVRGPVSSRSM